MINAQQARELLKVQPLTPEEIEEAIREAAQSRTFTTFERDAIPQAMIDELTSRDFLVEISSTDVIVNW